MTTNDKEKGFTRMDTTGSSTDSRTVLTIEKAPRFRVVFFDDAKAFGLPGTDWYCGDRFGYMLYDYSTEPPTFCGSDIMETEDALFTRDLKWVIDLLNQLDGEHQSDPARVQSVEPTQGIGSAPERLSSLPIGVMTKGTDA